MPTLSLVKGGAGIPSAARPAATAFTKLFSVIKIARVIDLSRGGGAWVEGLISRQWTGGHIGIRQPHGPFDRFGNHLLKFRLVPVRVNVAKRRVVNPSLAIHLRPGYREVAIGAVDILVLHVELAHVVAHQKAHLVPRIISHLVNLVAEHKGVRKLLHARKTWVFHNDGRIER